jgi:hypothetical protein
MVSRLWRGLLGGDYADRSRVCPSGAPMEVATRQNTRRETRIRDANSAIIH